MKYYIFLDDIRQPHYIQKVPGVPQNVKWDIVRSYDEFVNLLDSKDDLPEFISYDHDLCLDAVREYIRNEDKKTFNYYKKPMKPTGLECVKYILDRCKKENVKHPKYYIHSSNPIGADNMRNLIDQHNANIK